MYVWRGVVCGMGSFYNCVVLHHLFSVSFYDDDTMLPKAQKKCMSVSASFHVHVSNYFSKQRVEKYIPFSDGRKSMEA